LLEAAAVREGSWAARLVRFTASAGSVLDKVRTRSNPSLGWDPIREALDQQFPCLAIAWSREEPDRIGEVALVDDRRVLGRGAPQADDPAPSAGRALRGAQRGDDPRGWRPTTRARPARTRASAVELLDRALRRW
jgi:hypothetical protein